MGLSIALVAWSGLLVAQGPSRVADDGEASTPHHHAPRRKPTKKKPRKKPRGAPDAGTIAVAPPVVDASAMNSSNAESRAPAVGGAARITDDEDEDDDEEEATGSTTGDGGTPHGARARGDDGGVDAAADDDDEGDDDEGDDDEDTAYELGAELATESRQVWRGIAENRGAVLQTSAWAGLHGLEVEGFASYLLNAEGPFAPMSVVGADLTGSYALSLGDLRIRPGFSLLYFPEGLSPSTTAEASLGVSYRLGDFRVVSGTNIDVSLEPGAYFGTLGLSWGRAKAPWTVKAIADVGWASAKYNHEYLGREIAALDVLHAGASVRHDLGDVVYVELHVDVSELVAPTLRGGVQEPTIVVGGAAIGIDWSEAR